MYRIFVDWKKTGEITEQYFFTYTEADIVCQNLLRAINNGADLAYLFQEYDEVGHSVSILDFEGEVPENFENARWLM